tara:strand:+ start:56 stop:199 length:144 start_codon:yes stop_codon:yes gene_type:complete
VIKLEKQIKVKNRGQIPDGLITPKKINIASLSTRRKLFHLSFKYFLP